jgi:hypothetical protein
VHFGQFSIADLLVLRDFFDVDGDFWPLFRPLLGRTFEHDFWHSWAPVFTLRRFLSLRCSSSWACLVGFRCLACWFQVVGGCDRWTDRSYEWTRDSY